MKKEIVLFLVMSSVSTMSAMDFDLADRKKNSAVPAQRVPCCRPGSAVPVCDACFVRIVADNMLTVEKKPSVEQKKQLPLSCQMKRCS